MGGTEEVLTMKSLQSHLIKWMVTSLIGALALGLITSFGFYYNTKNELQNHDTDIKSINEVLAKHSESINRTTQSSSISDMQVKELDRRMTSIEENQKQIYIICMEIMSGQKELIKKTH